MITARVFNVTYHGKARTIIKRYRKCKHCGLQFTTIETYEDEENTNLPEDIQPFKPAPPPKAGGLASGNVGVYKKTQPTIPKASGPVDPPTDSSLPPKKPAASPRKRRKKD